MASAFTPASQQWLFCMHLRFLCHPTSVCSLDWTVWFERLYLSWHHVHHACQKYSLNEALISLFYNIPAGKKVLCTEMGGAPAQIFCPVVIYKCLFLKDQICFSSNSHKAIGALFMFTRHIFSSKYCKIFLISASGFVLQRVWLHYPNTVFNGSWVVELWTAVTAGSRNGYIYQ